MFKPSSVRVFLFASFFFCFGYDVSGQEMWGSSGSNSAGHMVIELNPAAIVAAPFLWEAHFVSADLSLLNNYYLLKRQSGWVRNAVKGSDADKGSFGDRYEVKPEKFIYSSNFLRYPGFIWSGRRSGIAFSFSSRAEWTVGNLPYHLAKYLKEGFDYDPQQAQDFSGRNIRSGVLVWHSAGLSYGRVVSNSTSSFITSAVTLNYNHGIGGGYVYFDRLKYTVPADTLLVVDQLEGAYGHALGDGGGEGSGGLLRKNGSGFSFSAGMQYFRNRNNSWFDPCNLHPRGRPYDFRLGFSLLDFGYIRFSPNARVYTFDDAKTDWYGIDTVKFATIEFADSAFSQQFNSSSVPKPSASEFVLFLPSAASIQFDLPVSERIFLNLSWMQRIPFSRYSLTRANQLAFIPRYETRRFEFSMPFSFYEMFRPRLGFGIRYGILTVGSDMPGAFLGLTDSFGADVYFGLLWKSTGPCSGSKSYRVRRPSIERCIIPR